MSSKGVYNAATEIKRKAIFPMFSTHRPWINKLRLRFAAHYSRVTGKPPATGFSFALFNSASQLPKDIWNKGTISRDIFLSSAYLTALEQAPPPNMQFRYAIISDKNIPVGIAYFQILELNHRLHRPPSRLFDKDKQSFFREIHDKIADTATLRLLICGNALLSGEHGFSFMPGYQELALQAIAEISFDLRKSIPGHISVTLIKDFYNQGHLPHKNLLRYGYYSFDAGPNMVVPIRKSWLTFDHYLNEMKPKYRKRVVSALKKGSPVKPRPLTLDEMVRFKQKIYDLYCRMANKAKFKSFVLSPDFFIALKKQLGESFACEGYFLGPDMIGFTTRIINGVSIEGYSHGVNYETSKQYEVYQNILLDDVKAALSFNAEAINTGRTSIAMKSSIGAIPRDMTCYMRFSGRLSNHLIKPLFYFIKPPNEPWRNPFE
jgi:hypothetical protein